MRFVPMKEEEISKIFQPGIYKFTVIKAEEKESKSGNEMIKITLKMFHNEIKNKTHLVDAYLMQTQPLQFLLRHFCSSVGMEEIYNMGIINESDCINRTGWVKIGIEVDKTGQYGDKNKVIDFIVKEEEKESEYSSNQQSGEMDDIPF